MTQDKETRVTRAMIQVKCLKKTEFLHTYSFIIFYDSLQLQSNPTDKVHRIAYMYDNYMTACTNC